MKKRLAVQMAKGVVLAYIISALVLVVLALLMYKMDLSESVVRGAIIFAYVVSCFVSGMVVSANREGRRYLWGLLQGVIYYVILLVVSMICNRAGESVKTDFDKDKLDLSHEKAVNEHWKSMITEIKLQLIKGQVHKSEDVERVMTDMFLKFKNKMLALPHKLAIKLENRGRQDIQKVLREEISDALTELADYTPEAFYSDEHIDIEDDVVIHLGDGQDE